MRDGIGAHSHACILLIRVLLMSKRVQQLTRVVKFEEFKKAGDKHPKRKFPIWDHRCSESMKSMMNLGMLTLMPFKK